MRRAARVLPLIFTFAAVAWLASRTPAQTTPPLTIYVNELVTDAVRAVYAQRGASDSIIVHESLFDPDGNGSFEHRTQFANAFAALVPRDYTGPVCIDWEGIAYLRLYSQPGTMAHAQAVKTYVDLITFAREIRPQAQLGFYAIPMSEYWDRNDAWRQRNFALRPIIDASDCLFPSVYDFYKTNQTPSLTADRDHAYVRECVAMALEMAQGKPVYPYVHPRYHPSNETYGRMLIPALEFKAHVRAVFDARYQGDRADGIVWWGADRYYRWLSQQNYPAFHPLYASSMRWRAVFDNEIPSNTSDDSYFNSLHRRILRQLSEVIRSVD